MNNTRTELRFVRGF